MTPQPPNKSNVVNYDIIGVSLYKPDGQSENFLRKDCVPTVEFKRNSGREFKTVDACVFPPEGGVLIKIGDTAQRFFGFQMRIFMREQKKPVLETPAPKNIEVPTNK